MSKPTTSTSDLTVRLARPSDQRRLAVLASLDSTPLPEGDLVVVESEGTIVAAKPLTGGPAIADPFVRTAALVQLLELRAEQLRDALSPRRPGMLERLRVLHERPAVRVN